MVSTGFLGGTGELLERSDGRYKYVQVQGEQCLSALVTTGRKIHAFQSVPREHKDAFLAVLDEINDHYFEARDFEADVRGKFYRYDETAERRLRSAITEELSDCVDELHRLLSAHEAIADSIRTATDSGSSRSTDEGARMKTLSRHTNYAVRGGWYPVVEAYDHSLDPGEKIAEGKRRRRQRVYGQEDIPGISQLLDTPLFDQISNDDLATIRNLDGFAPREARQMAIRLRNRHPWLLADQQPE